MLSSMHGGGGGACLDDPPPGESMNKAFMSFLSKTGIWQCF